MIRISYVKKLSLCAMCIALCCVLPMAFHAIGLGTSLSPMHIPVLLCGIVCGPLYGALCGIVGPLLSSVTTGMPGPAMLPSMIPELLVYGLICGLGMKLIRTKKSVLDIYISLVCAMILGRIVGGIVKMLMFIGTDSVYSIAIWFTSYFVGTLPGIIAHLILVPLLAFVLEKARLVSPRYPVKVTKNG